MVNFERYTLSNGLRLLIHPEHTTPMAVVNIMYDVGARDEQPDKTGFAHLFEHLMFGGSVNIPVYDEPLQRVGGENNAFTSNDITNYYVQLPAVNIETAFWLESDRMLNLAFSEKSLEVQKNVVCEEFKQRYLNQPYGDVWLNLRPLAYKTHPYLWATIGKELAHIENANLDDVKSFFAKHYNPLNAILVVSGDVESDKIVPLAEKWFGGIPSGEKYQRNLFIEPKQTKERTLTLKRKVPVDALYKAYHMCARTHADYYVSDIITDILSRGQSSRLFQTLVKETQIFSEINAYQLGSIDAGLMVLEGKPHKGLSLKEAESLLMKEIDRLKNELVIERELQKIKNKIESTITFSELSLLDKSINLAYFELLSDAADYALEKEKYLAVTAQDIKRVSNQIFDENNCSTIYYEAE